MVKKVLIIDNTASPVTSSRLLAGDSYDIDIVCDIDTGRQRLDNQVYNIIIMKAGPETESSQLCEEIRRLSGIPLIVISMNASADTCAKAINAGADYFLRKPLGPLEFRARVNSLIQRTALKPTAPAVA
jgi:two-component system KDP operon response regulator KdpE